MQQSFVSCHGILMPCDQKVEIRQGKKMNLGACALIGVVVLAASIAQAKHTHKNLRPKELAVVAQKIVAELLHDDGKTHKPQQLTKPEQQWAAQIDMTDTRFDGIGKLYVVETKDGTALLPWLLAKVGAVKPDPNKINVKAKPEQPKHCTAFKVADDVLATAGHCLYEAGVRENSPHVLVFRRHFDASKSFTPEMAKTHQNVVQEWIYPEEYAKAAKNAWAFESGYDYAFLRTATKIGGEAYVFVAPDEYIAVKPNQKLLTVGYPTEFAPVFQMASVSCKLAAANDLLVTEDKGITRAMAENKQLSLETIASNQIFCAGELGNMQVGGSGGPWLLDVPATDADRAKKLRKVVGISAWTFGRDISLDELYGTNGKTRADWLAKVQSEQQYAKISVSAKFKSEILNLYDAIIKSAASKSMKETAEAVDKGK